MKSQFARCSALAFAALGLSACNSYEPVWASKVFTVPIVGSLTETVSPAALTVAPGGSSLLTVTLTPADGFSDLVQFSPVGGPEGLTITPASIDLQGSAPVTLTLTLSAASTTAPGASTVTIVAANGNQAAEATVSLTVGN